MFPLLVIAVDDVAFAMNQEVESAGGSDTMKRNKKNRRERKQKRDYIFLCSISMNTTIFIDFESILKRERTRR